MHHREGHLGGLRSGAQLGASGLDGSEALGQPGPGPGLDFLVAERRLPAGRLQVLEPGVCLLDQEQLMGFALSGHQTTSGR